MYDAAEVLRHARMQSYLTNYSGKIAQVVDVLSIHKHYSCSYDCVHFTHYLSFKSPASSPLSQLGRASQSVKTTMQFCLWNGGDSDTLVRAHTGTKDIFLWVFDPKANNNTPQEEATKLGVELVAEVRTTRCRYTVGSKNPFVNQQLKTPFKGVSGGVDGCCG